MRLFLCSDCEVEGHQRHPAGEYGWKIGGLYPLDPAIGQQVIDTALVSARDWHGAAEGRITVSGGTLYTRWRDWFGWLLVGMLGALVAISLLRKTT